MVSRFWKWWALFITCWFGIYLFVTKGPIPFTEDGHCSYDVPDQRAAVNLLKVFRLAGLTEEFTFDSGPTHQCVLSDGKTVLHWLDRSERDAGGNANARSLVVDDPRDAAETAVTTLRLAGYTAQMREPAMELGANKLVLVNTNALTSGCLVFRRHVLNLGKPPNQRRISE